MAEFDSDFNYEKNFDEQDKDIEENINRYKEIVESGGIYECIESIEEIIQLCVDNEFYEDGLFFINHLLEVSPYNSEYWLRKGVLLNGDLNSNRLLSVLIKLLH
jgi:hypothetical protein